MTEQDHDDEHKVELRLATDKQIADELARRYRHVVICAQEDVRHDSPTSYAPSMWYRNGAAAAAGLAGVAHDLLIRGLANATESIERGEEC